jgi:hypothetical protein
MSFHIRSRCIENKAKLQIRLVELNVLLADISPMETVRRIAVKDAIARAQRGIAELDILIHSVSRTDASEATGAPSACGNSAESGGDACDSERQTN